MMTDFEPRGKGDKVAHWGSLYLPPTFIMLDDLSGSALRECRGLSSSPQIQLSKGGSAFPRSNCGTEQ